MSDNYGKHPSQKLQEIFSQRPFQLQEPEKAKIIILGLDANWDKDLENDKELFQEILDSLKDGVGYWKKNGFHSPMLSKAYKSKEGKRYHQNFMLLGFTPNDAQDICLLDLLNICTYGKTNDDEEAFVNFLKSEDNKTHRQRISELTKDKTKQFYLCGKGVVKYINDLQLFDISAPNIFLGEHFSRRFFNIQDYLISLKEPIRAFLDTGKYIPKDYNKEFYNQSQKDVKVIHEKPVEPSETITVKRNPCCEEGYYQFNSVDNNQTFLAKIIGNKRKAPDMYVQIQLKIYQKTDNKITSWSWE